MSEPKLAFAEATSANLVVQALCRDLVIGKVNLDIHASDEMLLFFLYSQGQPFDNAVALYLDSGKRIWATLRQILVWRFGSLAWGGRILDFASGYGRVTRHIVADLPPANVWVADIYAEGVAFQERQFGVHGVVSATDPARFDPGTTFDCIVVSSLFTHLPAATFTGWLRRLATLLTPGGLLVFSVHDMALRRGLPPPAAGIQFEPQSESGSLAGEDYGTTWVDEPFVRSAIQEAVGEAAVIRIRRGLANFQDLYVVQPLAAAPAATPGAPAATPGAATAATTGAATAAPPPAATLEIDRSPDAFVEHCSLAGKRRLRLSGWVGDRITGQPPVEIRVQIDGHLVASCRDLEPRPTEVFAADPMQVVGWQAVVELPAAADVDTARLCIRAVSSDGDEMELYADSILAALLRSAQLDAASLEHRRLRDAAASAAERAGFAAERAGLETELAHRAVQADGLRRQIATMEASRFWKARNHWHRFKSRFASQGRT